MAQSEVNAPRSVRIKVEVILIVAYGNPYPESRSGVESSLKQLLSERNPLLLVVRFAFAFFGVPLKFGLQFEAV